MKHICKGINAETFLRVYKTYILPIIEYSNMCWTPTVTQANDIEKIQKRITKFICNNMGKYNLKYNERLDVLNLKTLDFRRKLKILKIVQNIKCKNVNIPIDWISKLTFHSTKRNDIFIKANQRRICLEDKNLFNNSIKLFNHLPINVRNECNFKKFVQL